MAGDENAGSGNTAERVFPWFGLLLLLAVTVGVALVFLHDPVEKAILPPCSLYEATGLLCAGCGGTRSVSHLLHGRPLEALRCNVLFMLAWPVLLLYTAKGFLGPRLPIRLPDFRYGKKTATALLLIVLLFMVLRNIPAYPFTLLAPPAPPPKSELPTVFVPFPFGRMP